MSKVVETVCLWTFLPVEAEPAVDDDDEDDEDDSDGLLHDDEEDEGEDEEEEDEGGAGEEGKEGEEEEASTSSKKKKKKRPASLAALDLLLLIRSLQCYALRALDSLIKGQQQNAVAERLLAQQDASASLRPSLLRDLMRLAVRHKTDVRSLSTDLPSYEESLTLLLLHRHHTPLGLTQPEEAAAKDDITDKGAGSRMMRQEKSSEANGSTGRLSLLSSPTNGQQQQMMNPLRRCPLTCAAAYLPASRLLCVHGSDVEAKPETPPAQAPAQQQQSAVAEADLSHHPLVLQLAEMGFPENWCRRALEETVRAEEEEEEALSDGG